MNPYLSWVIVLLAAGGLGWYYRDKSSARTRVASVRNSVAEKIEQPSTSKKAKRRHAKKQEDTTSSSATPVEVQQMEGDAVVNKSQTAPSGAAVDTPSSDMDTLQFAKELSKAKTGTSLSGPSSSNNNNNNNNNNNSNNKGSKKKPRGSKGGSKGNQKLSVPESNASSTTGADADDDMSPIDTPQEPPVEASTVDVSDMLEAPAPAASVLRVTGSVDNESGKKKQKPENFKVAETKKQRQRRLKKENNRTLVKEAEQQRRGLVEKQQHTAREHERQEAAANSKPAQAPAANNAWKQGPPAGQSNGTQKKETSGPSTTTTTTTTSAVLLDTFAAEPEELAGDKPAQSKGSNSTTSGSMQSSWTQALPSEEEQLRMIGNMNSEHEWTTVSNRKKDRKNKVSDTTSEASSAASFTQPTPAPAPAPVSVSNTWTTPAPTSNGKSHPLDSDWPA